MRILHIDFTGTFNEEMSYQENLFIKYHSKDGHKVTMLTTCYRWDRSGNVVYVSPEDKIIEDGVRLIRMDYVKIINKFITSKIRKVDGVHKLLEGISPEIIFVHGSQTIEMLTIIKYIKSNPDIRLFIDCHTDFSNSATNYLSLYLLHKIIWKYFTKKAEPYTTRFYGVLPARVDFLTEIYKVARTKCELLVMGADDEKVTYVRENNIRDKVRNKFNFSDKDFIIISGGKIDSAKTQVLNLIEAVQSISNPNIKLLLFGSIEKVLKEKILLCVDNKKIFYSGWIDTDEIYNLFAASDLGIFPGRHSVLWEQAVGIGLPCFFKYWEGTTHVDVGGNCRFLLADNSEEIKENIEEMIKNPDFYMQMKKVSEEIGIKNFSYREISRKAIQFP